MLRCLGQRRQSYRFFADFARFTATFFRAFLAGFLDAFFEDFFAADFFFALFDATFFAATFFALIAIDRVLSWVFACSVVPMHHLL